MKTQKIINLLNSSENEYLKLATRKWYVIDSETTGGHSHHKPINFITVYRINRISRANRIKSF